jgi:hypothetical protein
MITFVTAASSNHYNSLCQFLSTISDQRVYVYDLGLSLSEKQFIQSNFKIEYRVFAFEKYPSFVALSSPDAGAYAWKPIIISEVYSEIEGLLVWCDAGNKVYNVSALSDCITKTGIYTPTSSGTIRRWTHPSSLFELAVPNTWLDKQMRNAACVGFRKEKRTTDFISEWKSYALNQNAILPHGANRLNHRHDQSILTILYYKHNLQSQDEYIGFSIHNDIG